MNALKILFVTAYVPGPVRVRSYELVRALSRAGHAVTVVAPIASDEERRAAETLRNEVARVIVEPISRARVAWNTACALATGTSMQLHFSWCPALARRLEEVLEEEDIDVVHVEHLRGGRYAHHLLNVLGSGRSVPVVWDSVDSITHLFEQASRRAPTRAWRWITRMELARTRRAEADLLSRADRVLTTSSADRDALHRSMGTACHAGIEVVPNGVDTDRFAPTTEPRGDARIVFSGKMSYHANVAAALHLVEEIMPIVWRSRPETILEIVGQRPPRAIERLARAHAGRIVVTGRVPDVAAYLARARVAVAPIPYGAGIQNKVLEALACGTPVVASPIAAGGLGVASSETGSAGVCVAETPERFAEAIVDLLDDPTRARALGRRGLAYVEKHHAWEKIVTELEGIYRSAAAEIPNVRTVARRTPRAKRVIDCALASLALLLLAPAFAILAIIIRLDSPGPVFHRRRVLGVGRITFIAYKFRTMIEDGDGLLAGEPDLLEELRHTGKLRKDPRVTRSGRWLRPFSLDELPQLLNVLRGEMSLVGPRMISPEELSRYGSTSDLLLSVRPGITGLWQVSGRSDLSYEERVALDREYVEAYSLVRDLKILFLHTLPAVLKRRGAY